MPDMWKDDILRLISLPSKQNIYKNHRMPAKPSDFNRSMFSDC